MLYRIWFYTFKASVPGLILAIFGAALTPVWPVEPVLLHSGVGFFLLVGVIGRLSLVLTHLGLRFACPVCCAPSELCLMGRHTVAIECDGCGLVYGRPWIDWKLRVVPYEEPDDEDASWIDDGDADLIDEPTTFLQRTSSLRHWGYWFAFIFGIAMASAGGWMLWNSLLQYGWEILGHPLGLLFVFVFIVGGLGFALYVGYLLLFAPLIEARIDTSGITINAKHWAWDDIKSVYNRAMSPDANILCFQPKRFSSERLINIMPYLTSDETYEILDQIERFTERNYPHVTIE